MDHDLPPCPFPDFLRKKVKAGTQLSRPKSGDSSNMLVRPAP